MPGSYTAQDVQTHYGSDRPAVNVKVYDRLEDVTWLGVLGEEGDWCVLSADHHITRHPDELQALLDARLLCFETLNRR